MNHKTFGYHQAIYRQHRLSELEHSVCFPLIILKIYWLKDKSHDYLWRRNLCKRHFHVSRKLITGGHTPI